MCKKYSFLTNEYEILNKHLRKKSSDVQLSEQFVFVNPTLVSKVGMGETTKENRSTLIANHFMLEKRADYIFIPYNPE